MNIKTWFAVVISLFAVVLPAAAQNKLNVVATTEDLAAIAREVGGDRVTVDSIARGFQDPHFVEAKPSFILKLQKADLLTIYRHQPREQQVEHERRHGEKQSRNEGAEHLELAQLVGYEPVGKLIRARIGARSAVWLKNSVDALNY